MRLIGTSVPTEVLDEFVARHSSTNWQKTAAKGYLETHDFSDPLSQTHVDNVNTQASMYLRGSMITLPHTYRGSIRAWLVGDQLIEKLDFSWTKMLLQALKYEDGDFVDQHKIKISAIGPHRFIATLQWSGPSFSKAPPPRRLVLNGPMHSPEQARRIIDLVRASLAAEPKTEEEAYQTLIDAFEKRILDVASGKELPTIRYQRSSFNSDIRVRAEADLLNTNLQHEPKTFHLNYRVPVIDNYPAISSHDIKDVERHYRYLPLWEEQGGRMRITALAAWLCRRENGTINTNYTRMHTDILGKGFVEHKRNKGRIEATFKSDKLIVQTGKITLIGLERYPETVIAALKGEPLNRLIELPGIHPSITITSIAYDQDKLVARIRDTSNLFLNGDRVVDETKDHQ